MTDLAAATMVVLALVCDLSGVVDVSTANNDGAEEVVVVVTDSYWHDEVRRKGVDSTVRPLFGYGSFTGDTWSTKWAFFILSLPGAEIAGTIRQKAAARLMDDVWAREIEAWRAMSDEEKNKAVADKITQHRNRGDTTFGNCLADSA